MSWIDDIQLVYENIRIKIKKVNFRNSFFNDLCKLYSSGYLDVIRNFEDENNKIKIRYSKYLPIETMTENLLRLREIL